MRGEENNGWDTKKIVNDMALGYRGLLEHGIEPFEEALRKDPEKAIAEFDRHLERTLNTAVGLFKGYMCGGPAPEATGGLIDRIGIVYHHMSRELRTKALQKSLNTIQEKNYFYAQLDVEKINNPWLAMDLVINGFNLWCGYSEYLDVEKCKDWYEFEERFVIQDERLGVKRLRANSEFWLARAVADTQYTSDYVRQRFEAELPELTDMTKDAIAAHIHDNARYWEARIDRPEDVEPYEQGVQRRLKKYDKRWQDDLVRKIDERKWIVLPDREQQCAKEYWERFVR